MPKPSHIRLSLTNLEDRWTPAAGDLDFSFGDHGIVQFPPVPVEGGQISTTAERVAVMTDGRIVIAGQVYDSRQSPPDGTHYRTQVTRLLTDGRPDGTFGIDGTRTLPLTRIAALAVQPDGRVLVADDHGGISGSFTVARLTADGRPDTGFGTDGVATVAVAGGVPNSLSVTPDGGVVVAGLVYSDAPAVPAGQLAKGTVAFAAARFTPDGRPDLGFDADGVATVEFPVGEYNSAEAHAVAVQPDGKVVLAGHVNFDQHTIAGRGFGDSSYYDADFAAARLNGDGSLDQGFGTGGRVRIGFDSSSQHVSVNTSAVRVLADGRIVAAGQTTVFGGDPAGVAIALNPAGTPDPTFDTDGRSLTPVGLSDPNANTGSVYEATVLPNGGTQFLGQYGRLFRLTETGQPDLQFGANGFVQLSRTTFQQDQPFFGYQDVLTLLDGGLAAVGGVVGATINGQTGTVARYQGTAPGRFVPFEPGMISVGGRPDGTLDLLVIVAGQYSAIGTATVYPDFGGSVRTATADVTGDGTPDYIAGPGPGGGPNVVVLDGRTGARVVDLDAFETTFTGGVFVAAADLDGDGKAEVVVTPDRGGGPAVAVYDGAGLATGRGAAAERFRFYGIEDPAFRGGARAALGDVDGDSQVDLVVAAGFGGGPRVAVYDGAGVLAGRPRHLVNDFFVFEQTLRNGVFVSAGDLTGDGAAELVFGGGPGGGPRVFALDGRALIGGTQTTAANFFAGDSNSRGGVHVAVRTDLTINSVTKPRIVTGSGDGEAARVRAYDPTAATAGGGPDTEFTPFDGAALAEGVFVG